jgi:hypothetical protein
MRFGIEDFVRESNRIEGIRREPTEAEIGAHETLLGLGTVMLQDIERFVGTIQPGARLRISPGMNVRVGSHIPPSGGVMVGNMLADLLHRANLAEVSDWQAHVEYETLHPFMDGNGRSGRALWLWMRGGIDKTPLGFLHHFYYQTLQNTGRAT